MGWFPLLVLIVFGMVSIAFMMQMPKEKPQHNIKRVIRGTGADPVVEPEEVVDVVDESLFEEYGNKKWTGCDPFLKGSIQDGLRNQLRNVIRVFDEINVQHAIYGGTLIGALRDNGMNENEVDNDLMVPSEFTFTESMRRVFFVNGLHVFKDRIYRICNIGSMVSSRRFWDDPGSQYCLYTVLYPFLPYMHCDPHIESTNNIIRISGYEKVKIDDFEATMPNLLQAEQCLNTRYGQWRKEYKESSWRNKLLTKYIVPTIKNLKHGEHGITDKILKMLPNGQTFVEMGANDGLNSNTHYIEQLGWRGLCIEAGPSNFDKLKKNRPGCTNIQAVVSEKESTTIFREFPEGGLYGHSGLKDARSDKSWKNLIKTHNAKYIDHEVRTTTLDKIFEENRLSNIDFFSLDIEGAEMSVLHEYPFKTYPVKIWAIESNKLDRKKLVQFMSDKGYICFHFNNVNTICEYTETTHMSTHCTEEDIKDAKATPLCRGYKYSVTHKDWMSKTFEYYHLQELTIRFDNPTFNSPMNMITEDGGKHDPRMKVEYDYCENISPFFKKNNILGDTMPGTTLLLFRKDDHNPFFMLSLLINALWVKEKHNIDVDRVIFLGEDIPQKIDDMFEKSLGKVEYIKDLNNLQFEDAWVLPNEYTGPLMSHLNDKDHSCMSSTVPTTVNKLLSLYDKTPQENLITIISRQNYNNRKLQRVMTNEKELAEALPGVVERVQLEHMTMQEQITQMQRSRLVIAMHGAGNVHIAWLHKEANFIEIFPKHKHRYGYKHLAKYMGVEYREYRGGRDGPNDSKVLDIDNFMKVNNDWLKKNLDNFKPNAAEENRKNYTVFFGTRPEFLKLMPVIQALHRVQIVFTGQHPDLVLPLLEECVMKPDIILENVFYHGQTLSNLTSNILTAVVHVDKNDDTIWIVQGDTTTTYSIAYAAFLRNIPIVHIEAGLRTYNMLSPFPEEFNRQSVSVIASINFAPTKKAATALHRQGIPESRVFVVGNTGVDSARIVSDNLFIPQDIREKIQEDKLLIFMTMHRRENRLRLSEYYDTVANVVSTRNVQIIVPEHPNPDANAAAKSACRRYTSFLCVEPLDYRSTQWILERAYLIVTDSGGLQEEATWHSKPVLVVRQSSERAEAIEAGVSLLTYEFETLKSKLELLLLPNSELFEQMSRRVYPFGDGHASEKIVKIMNNFNWKNSNLKQNTLPFDLNLEDETCAPHDNPIKACSKENTIDVVLTVWKRSTLQRQLSYVEYQSIEVSNVWVVQNENYVNIDKIIEKYQTKSFKVHVVKFSKNSGYHGRFHIAYFMSQAEYVSVWDDDIIVYKQWLDYSIQESKAHNDALVGANGRNVISIQPFKQKGESIKGSVGDFVGHTWTLKRSLLRHYFADPQLTYATGEDMQLSFALKKHGVVSWTPDRQTDDRRAGDMPQSGDIYASFKKPKTNNVRRWLVCSLILKGFDFKSCLDCTVKTAQDCIEKEDKILQTIKKGEIGYNP